MAKTTIFFLFTLALIASLLFGINLGKKLDVKTPTPTPLPSPTVSPTVMPSQTVISTGAISQSPNDQRPATNSSQVQGTSSFSDATCGFSFTYPGSYLRSNSENGKSTIFLEEKNQNASIVATCGGNLPRPPVSVDKIESIMVSGVPATLYHDKNPDGTPRDEVIVKHPTNGKEIIIAGYGPVFQTVLASFKFI